MRQEIRSSIVVFGQQTERQFIKTKVMQKPKFIYLLIKQYLCYEKAGIFFYFNGIILFLFAWGFFKKHSKSVSYLVFLIFL